MIFKKDAITAPTAALGPPAGFTESLVAAYQATVATELSNSRAMLEAELLSERAAAVLAITGKTLREQTADRTRQRQRRFFGGGGAGTAAMQQNERERQEERVIAQLKAELPIDIADQLPSRGKIKQLTRERALKRLSAGERAALRSTGLGQVGGFFGTVGGTMRSPINMLSLTLGAPAASGVLRTALIEGLISGGAEIPDAMINAEFREELGLEVDVTDRVFEAAAGGFVLGGGVRGLLKIADPQVRRAALAVMRMPAKRLIKTAESVLKKPTAEERAALDVLGQAEEADAQNPFASSSEPTPAEREQHQKRQAEAEKAIEEGGLPIERVAEALPRRAPQPDNAVELFDPAKIDVDAATFQFKAGGDAAGVTKRLAGVQQWDPAKAGVAIVWEGADGRLFVADGHQRVALAKRLEADGQKVRLRALRLREVDGISAEEARAIAAAKNVAEGSGTVIDAAKVFRDRPDLIDQTMPMTVGFTRTAKQLAQLEDEAFGFVVNDLVRPEHGMLVPRFAPDDAQLQTALMRVLAETEPSTIAEAESLIRQALEAGVVRETQSTLFGEEIIADSLFKDRAKVLSRTIGRLQKDKAAFRNLVRNEEALTEAGNRLDTEEALKRIEFDDAAQHQLQVLANRKGPLSDALTLAAQRARSESRFDGAVSDFLGAVRRAVAAGDFDGSELRAAGRAGVDPGAVQEPPRQPDLVELDEGAELFDAPGGKGQEAQLEALESDLALEQLPDDFEVPIEEVVDAAGDVRPVTRSVRALRQELEADREFVEQLELICGTAAKPGGET